MTDENNTQKPMTRREMRAMQRNSVDETANSNESEVDFSTTQEPVAQPAQQTESADEVRYTPGSSPKETLYFGEAPKFVADQKQGSKPAQDDDIASDLPKFEVPRSDFLDSLLNGTFRAESLITDDLVRGALGDEEFNLEPPSQSAPSTSPIVTPTVSPTPVSSALPKFDPIPTTKFEPTRAAEPPKPAEPEIADPDEGLFRIPSNLTGEIATASIVIDTSTNPLDIIGNPTTGSIPIRTGSIDIQLPESRPSVQAPRTDPIRAQTKPDTGAMSQAIAPLKSQTIALTGELGHQRGVNFKPIDTQKYWVLGTGLLMVVVGVATLVSFLMGYIH